MNRALLSHDEIAEASASLNDGWQTSAQELTRTVEFATFLAAVEFVQRLAPIAERLDHHPDLSLSWRTVTLSLTTHSSGGVTALDLLLAGELDDVIASLADYTPGGASR